MGNGFPEATMLKYDKPLAPQIQKHLEKMKKASFIRYNIEGFTNLPKNEKQVNRNFIAVEQDLDGKWVVFDNVCLHEKHQIVFDTSKEVSEYIANLLVQPTKMDYSQTRLAKRYRANIGDDVYIVKDGYKQKAKLLGYRDIHKDSDSRKNDEVSVLYYIPYNKDGKLSKVAPRIVYSNMEVEPIEEEEIQQTPLELKSSPTLYRMGRMYSPTKIKKMTMKRGYELEHKYKSNHTGIYTFKQEVHMYAEKGSEEIRIEFSGLKLPLLVKGNFKKLSNKRVLEQKEKQSVSYLRKIGRPGTVYQDKKTTMQSKNGILTIQMPITSEKMPELNELLAMTYQIHVIDNKEYLLCDFDSKTAIEILSSSKIELA